MSIAISVHVTNKNVYIIGGGNVAYRKACAYLKEGANITIIAPQVADTICALDTIQLIVEPFSWDYVIDAFMIYVATNDECLNLEIIKEAKRRNLLCGCANHLEDASFTSMKQEDHSHLQIAISTKVSFPYANTLFLSAIQPQIEQFNQKLKVLRELRKHILAKKMHLDSMVFNTLASLTNTTLEKLQQAILTQKKIVILAYHGVADMKTVASDMMEMNTLCDQAKILAIDVFISAKVFAKARKKGYEIDAIDTVTSICDTLNITYVIQPMLISNGAYMKQLQETYTSTIIGKVLCDNMQDVQEVTSSLLKRIEKPGCFLYHKSESGLANQLQQQDIYAFSYDEEVPMLSTSSLTLQCFSIFVGYHAYKDVRQTWLPTLTKQGVKVTYITHGLLNYEFVRMKFMQRIQTII